MPQDAVTGLGLADRQGERGCWLRVILDASHKISELHSLTCEMGIILIGLV